MPDTFELHRLEERVQEIANELSQMQGRFVTFAELPESVTRLRVDMGRLKATVAVVGGIVVLIVPVLTAFAISMIGK